MTEEQFYKKWTDWWMNHSGLSGFEAAVSLNHHEFMQLVKKISEDAKHIKED